MSHQCPEFSHARTQVSVNRLAALFAFLIIHLFQLVFSVGTVFFSYNKSAGTVFQLVFSAKRTGPIGERAEEAGTATSIEAS